MIILASVSPRRKELISKIVKDYEVVSPSFDESKIKPDPKWYPINLGYNKAKSIIAKDSDIVIGADTIVYCEGHYLGKPKDLDEAKKMLRFLSGKRHQVMTGLCILYKNNAYMSKVTSNVYFNELSDADIDQFLKDEYVLDKAGAYAVQTKSSVKIIKKIKGSYSNVVGLPLEKLESILKQLKAI